MNTLAQKLEAEVVPSRARAAAAVAAKEWLELRRSPRARVLAALMALLMLAAFSGGVLQFQRQAQERAAAQGADRALWTGQGSKDPHGAAHFGQWAFKPPSIMALAEPGVDAYTGGAVWMEAHKRNEMQFRPARDQGATARMGALNLAFVLQVVMPLVVIVLGFNAMTGERERGTLRQLLGQGVPPTALLLGKGLALGRGLLWLLAPLAAVLAASGWLLARAQTSADASADAVSRALLWTAGHGLYLLGFVALTLAVSAWARSSRAALVTLMATWLLVSFIAPRAMTELAQAAVPLPSAQAFRERIASERRKTFGHDENHPAFVAYRNELLKQHGVTRVEDLPLNFRGLALRKDDELGYAIYDHLYGELDAALQRQDRLRAAPGALLPLLALQPLSMALAGTDSAHQRHFADAAEAHRRVIQTLTSEDLIRNQRHGDTDYVASQALWEQVPPFVHRGPGAAQALSTVARDSLGLLIWPAWTLALAWLAGRRLRAV